MLTRKEVEEIALLARLHLSPDELERMQHDLDAILAHFRMIAVADTNDVPPMTHAVPVDAPLRPDVPAPSLPAADALRGAPRRDGDLFVVPAIIPGSE
ncbi:MAG TPA: Asp-tRNA(Asn)/Glu-tRNA(Gln) amidotransferase subunit GatC [Kofleriaceae bacterium]|nr:Asp-tRNA(Asn)/Glu-tRNA(Gln) amidotransferase subunit GatC [Kofleriaceae bacterium]